jgi:pyruvate/2-oxoglutarate dehydrogenase complex dihydrolipoamide dehydrogenase (E3) component/uncharacterized membrane protein YdjX (TVP38/TMEM64 family)
VTTKQITVLLAAALLAAGWVYFDISAYLQFDVLQLRLDELREWRAEQSLWAPILYFVAYVVATALSVPGAATVMTLAGGALFGFWYALLLVSFASSIGATLAFAVSRVLLRDWVQQRFGRQLQAVNAGFAKDGAFYLLSLRLVPLFPFFVINLVMSVLPIRPWRFYWVSQLGMLPATAVYVNAGTQLGALRDPADILSPPLLLSLVLLGVFPLVAKQVLAVLQARRAYAGFQRPKRFDTNLVVIGAGSAGLVTALIAATVKARVTLIERDKMGGDCLNTGCVPSKALLRSARIANYMRRAPEFGLAAVDVRPDFSQVMARVHDTIARIEPHDSVERFTSLGVDCVSGEARLVSPWEVDVDGRRISARHIVIATGARPRVPDIPGLDALDYLTSDTLWSLSSAPDRLLVLGGGPIGCELAQAMHGLGVAVTLVTHAERLLPREDEEVSEQVQRQFLAQGIAVHCGWEVREFGVRGGAQCGHFDTSQGARELEFDRLLLAVGRQANTENIGLEQLGLEYTADGRLAVDDYLRTRLPNVLACGDVVGPHLFTHMASHQAWYAAVNALFGQFRKFRVDYSVVPWATFTDPEVARVGVNEREAQAQGLAYEVSRYDLQEHDRAIADGEASGFVKVLTEPGRDRILGATIVGYHAGELVNEFVLAMKHGIGLNKILGTIHIYPTLGEANKFVAGEWRKARKPERLLAWVERYHRWRRG